MVTIKVDENVLLNMLVERVKYWSDDEDVVSLYEGYYKELLDCGCFEGMEFDPMLIVDNDYVNYIDVVADNDLESMYDIEDITDDRIVYRNVDKGLNLVQTY